MEIQVEGLDVKTSVVGVDGADFTKALRVEVNGTPAKDTNAIFKLNKREVMLLDVLYKKISPSIVCPGFDFTEFLQ